MFGFLYDSVLPIVGEFFGKLYGFATMTCQSFLDFISFRDTSVRYHNLFTGEAFTMFFSENWGDSLFLDLFKIVLTPVRGVFKFTLVNVAHVDIVTTPLWAGLLIWLITFGLIIALVKFIVDVAR